MSRAFSFFIILIIPFTISLVPAHANNEKMKIVVQSALENFIRPGYLNFKTQSQELNTSIQNLCSAPSDVLLEKAKANFKKATLAWAHIELIRFGPIMAENRLERVLYYPDRKGRGLKQIQKVLFAEDKSAVNEKTLSKKSIAVQGFPALEFVLFGTGSEELLDPKNEFRCEYASSISSNISTIAVELDEAWKTLTGVRENFKADNAQHTEDAMVSLLSSFVHGLETIHYLKIGGFLSRLETKDRPKKAIYARSGNTFPSILANIDSLRKLFTASRMAILLPEGEREGISKYFLPKPKSPVVRRIKRVLNNIISDLDEITESPEEAVANPDTRYLLSEVKFEINKLVSFMVSDYVRQTGIRPGFSFGDGD